MSVKSTKINKCVGFCFAQPNLLVKDFLNLSLLIPKYKIVNYDC